MLSEAPEEADTAERLNAELHEIMEEIDDAVVEALNASKDEQAPATAAVKGKIDRALAELQGNPLVQCADENPFGVKTDILPKLGGALGKVVKTMPAIA